MTPLISENNVQDFRNALITWWYKNGRSFPWRNTNNVFHILLSEIMLQRTQANQVVPVFDNFIITYPLVSDVINASEIDLYKSLYSLGLPQRIKNLISLTHEIQTQFSGRVPDSYDELRQLPGVGDYVASAVSCFGFGMAVIIVDTNTVRIIGRIFGIQTHAESRRDKVVREKHQFLLDVNNPKAYNYALLDLGADVCTPRDPICTSCPIVKFCLHGQRILKTLGFEV